MSCVVMRYCNHCHTIHNIHVHVYLYMLWCCFILVVEIQIIILSTGANSSYGERIPQIPLDVSGGALTAHNLNFDQ